MSAYITAINGPVCEAKGASDLRLRDMVLVGEKALIGEVIALEGERAVLQIYEETEGLALGATVTSQGRPLSVCLGPGMMGTIFDGIQRPLERIQAAHGGFIPEGVGLLQLDEAKHWELTFTVAVGDEISEGAVYATVQESQQLVHKLMVPPGKGGTVLALLRQEARLHEPVLALKNAKGEEEALSLCQYWPVRKARPARRRLPIDQPLLTGQRVLDTIFPLGRGGTAAIPGGFGTGKTMLQHQIAKWAEADIIIYIGCGERGNEMTDALASFQSLVDPRTGRSLIERTILLANTSNMPVAAREASIYTGMTMAEYYREMGYDVAIMADSTSRWAEALREIAGRLEEMPAEEGYPAYLASRLAQFYERAGRTESLAGLEGSVSIIGAVSPAGGDLSEPVTENTKRYVGAFWALDRSLAYARHYPAIQWGASYSSYAQALAPAYHERLGPDFARDLAACMQVLQQEMALQDIARLIGASALADGQRLTLLVARLIREGFLQQNAFHKVDSFMPLPAQAQLLSLMHRFANKAKELLALRIPYEAIASLPIVGELLRLKYAFGEDDAALVAQTQAAMDTAMNELKASYAPLLQRSESGEEKR